MRRFKTVLTVLVAVFILLLGTAAPSRAIATDLLITGVFDGPLTGGIPKAIELYVVNDIPDLSIYGVGSANNGGGTDGEEFTFPADAATAGDFIYLASESTGFNDFFGFAPNYTAGAASINGDDAIELFENGVVIDTFGDINVDGNGEPWEYLDGWAYRVSGTEADSTIFNIANWTFSGPNAMDGETSNATAVTPFPLGTFAPLVGDAAPSVASTDPANAATGVALDANVTVNFSEDVTVTGSWFDVSCTVSGAHTAVVSGGPASFTLDPDTDFVNGESCTVTIFAAQVTDNDTDDPPDAMNADASWSFDTVSISGSDLIINEVDADQTSTDDAEFVELFDGGIGNTDLTGHVLVFFNGSDDASYASFDLDGFSTNANGYFVLCGDAANTANCDLDVSPDTNLIQNGADAVALLLGDAASFPNDTPLTTIDLLDAIVYDTADSDDAGLLPLLNAGQPQVDEDGAGNKDGDSNQRCDNGSGGARNTDTYAQWAPTPGEENICEIVAPPITCETPDVATPIYTIQGNSSASPLDGMAVVIDGVVVGDFQENDGDHTDLDGFHVQDPAGDGDPSTSDGIYVFAPGAIDVVIGDLVRVSGVVDEFFDMTEITNVDAVLLCGSGTVAPTSITIPTDLEPYEGM
ncbi:Alkaline phosphatase, partial [hydrothermal vent metagenome]